MMRLYTVQVVCRLDDDGDPAFSVDVDIEDGVPDVIIDTIPTALRGMADQIERRRADGTVNVVRRD